jgi:hypothetical protein
MVSVSDKAPVVEEGERRGTHGATLVIDLPQGQEHQLSGNAERMGRQLWWLEARQHNGATRQPKSVWHRQSEMGNATQ